MFSNVIDGAMLNFWNITNATEKNMHKSRHLHGILHLLASFQIV